MSRTGRRPGIHRMFALARRFSSASRSAMSAATRVMPVLHSARVVCTGSSAPARLVFIGGASVVAIYLAASAILAYFDGFRRMMDDAYLVAPINEALNEARSFCAGDGDSFVPPYANVGPAAPGSSVDTLIEHHDPDQSYRDVESAFSEMGRLPATDSRTTMQQHDMERRWFVDDGLRVIYAGGGAHVSRRHLFQDVAAINADAFEILRSLSSYEECGAWTFGRRPAPGALRLLGSLLWPASYLESRFDWDDPIHDDLFGYLFVQMGWNPDPIYWNAWRGTHHFTFTHPEKTELSLSVWIPVSSGPAFLQRVMTWLLFTWAALVLAWGSVLAWWALKPLRTLARSARAAGKIVEADDGAPDKLKSLANGLPSGTDAFREMKALLHGMSSLLGERERWMGDVVHQLKNNLAVLSANLPKLQAAGNGDAAGPSGSAFEEINKAADMISGTLKSVEVYQWALFGRPEEKVRLDLDSMLDTIAGEIEDLGGEIAISYAARRPLNVHGRRTALLRALQNLIGNAHHHGGAIKVGVQLTDGDRKAVITIDDDGPGIDDDEFDEIFKPYRRGRKPRGHGAGLGLTIAAGVISDHGGEITVSNREAADGSRAGLRVCVALPLNG